MLRIFYPEIELQNATNEWEHFLHDYVRLLGKPETKELAQNVAVWRD